MLKRLLIMAIGLALIIGSVAQAKDWVKELKDKDAAKRAQAAAELRARAMDKGLNNVEIDALATATNDSDANVRRLAAEALAGNTAIAVGEEYAPLYAAHGDNYVAFLLWYGVFKTYEDLIDQTGGDENMAAARDEARGEAKLTFGRIQDEERKNLAQTYYDGL